MKTCVFLVVLPACATEVAGQLCWIKFGNELTFLREQFAAAPLVSCFYSYSYPYSYS
ncbi:hypothetical protein N9L68_01435 [bacterium]|nr:hypothetical protein [bacterium]